MENALEEKLTSRKIEKDQEIFIRYNYGRWESSNDGQYFPLYDRCAFGGSDAINSHKVCVHKLVLKYDEEKPGELILDSDGFQLAKERFTSLQDEWNGMSLARVEYKQGALFKIKQGVGYLPCNIQWSNVQRSRLSSDAGGKCLRFAAASEGNIYVVFAAVPADPSTWYYVDISSEGVGILKVRGGNKCKGN